MPVAELCKGANGAALQLIPRSRETNNPSSAAAYQASRPNAISFTLARNGIVSFVVADDAAFVGVFAPRVVDFFFVVVWRGCRVAAFSITWFTAIQDALELS